RALAAHSAAMPRAQQRGEIERGLLTFDLTPALLRVRVREVGRETDHRRDLPRLGHRALDRIDILGRQTPEETVVVFDTFPSEIRCVADPPLEGHAAVDELVEETFREDADAWRHAVCGSRFAVCRLRASQFGGAPIGYCSISMIVPVTASLASLAKYSAATATSRGVSRRPNGRVATALSSQSGSCSSSRLTRSSPSVRVHPTLIWFTRIR